MVLMSTRPGSTFEAIEEMSEGAPAPAEVLPDEPDPNGEVSPPEEPEPPSLPEEPEPPGSVAGGEAVADEVLAAGHTA